MINNQFQNNKNLITQNKTSPEQVSDNRPHPFSSRTKKSLLSKIKNFSNEKEKLQKILTEATLNFLHFPSPLYDAIFGFQHTYKIHQGTSCGDLTEKTISHYFAADGYNEFLKLLETNKTTEWNSETLQFLSHQLSIAIDVEPVIEGIVHDGKIHWRVIKEKKIVYQNPSATQNYTIFSSENTWHMSPEFFIQFKNAGKRGGNIAIEKEHFSAYFKETYHDQASAVWEELKNKNILNKKNRLSQSWRALSNKNITLNTLTHTDHIISKEDILSCLDQLNAWKKSIPRETFINYWDPIKQIRAGEIWDHFKEKNFLDNNNKMITNRNFKIQDFLNNLHLNYKDITEAVYTIVDSPPETGNLARIINQSTFRKERTPKNWALTGKLTHTDNESEQYCTKRWDVSIYHDLVAHRNTENEGKNGGQLDYDHIPSTDALKRHADIRLEQLEEERTQYKTAIKDIEEKIAAQTVAPTRAKKEEQINLSPQLKALHEEKKALEEKITAINEEQEQILKETKGHGPSFWAISIPHELHTQGSTYMASSHRQKNSAENSFLNDIKAYIKILNTRAHEFNIEKNEHLTAIGAFRYLYRQQVKDHSPVAGIYSIGKTPSLFFNHHKQQNSKIDALLNKEIKEFVAKKEGPSMKRK